MIGLKQRLDFERSAHQFSIVVKATDRGTPHQERLAIIPYEKYYNTTAILLQYVNKILAKILFYSSITTILIYCNIMSKNIVII